MSKYTCFHLYLLIVPFLNWGERKIVDDFLLHSQIYGEVKIKKNLLDKQMMIIMSIELGKEALM